MNALRTLHSLQQKASTAEKLAMLAKIICILAHEVKQDLGVIANWTHALEDSRSDNSDVLEACDAIRHAAVAVSSKLRRLETGANTPPPRFENVSLILLLSHFVSTIKHAAVIRGIEIVLNTPEGDAVIRADPAQLQQLFEVFFDNSCEAVRGRTGATIAVGAGAEPDGILLSWRDNGRGMSEHAKRSCFEPFFTTKKSHVGLGLHGAKNIVKNHGGRIAVESWEGKGTCFTIMFPSYTEESQS